MTDPNLVQFEKYLSYFCCPIDHSALSLPTSQEVVCSSCGRKFPIIDGIPAFKLAPTNPLVKTQMTFHDQSYKDIPLRKVNYVTFSNKELITSHVRKIIHRLGPLNGKIALDSCAGNGKAAEILLKETNVSLVITSDISLFGLKAARQRLSSKYLNRILFIQCDAESLPFHSNKVDICIVVDGLHHLRDKWEGLRELIRINKLGLVLEEPLNNAVIRLLAHMGIATTIETSGNYVWRYKPEEFKNLATKYNSTYIETYFIHNIKIVYHPFFNSPTGILLFRSLHKLLDKFLPVIIGVCAMNKKL